MLTRPVEGATVWRAADWERSDAWLLRFTEAELDELGRAVRPDGRLVPGGAPASTPMPLLDTRLAGVIHELDWGRGFVVLRGAPGIDGYDRDVARAVVMTVSRRVGRLVPTERDGRLLNDVYDRGPLRDPNDRVYTTNLGGYLHTDGPEIVGLMCLQPSAVGGESIIASSMTLYNTLLEEHPEWLPILYKTFACDWRNEAPPGSRGWYPQPMYCHVDGWLSGALRTGYTRSAQRFADVPALTDDELECLAYLDAVPQRPGMTFQHAFEAGDVQLVNNYVTLHSRQPYDDPPGEPEKRRHMLRTWISRSGLGPRQVSPEFEAIREDYFGFTQKR